MVGRKQREKKKTKDEDGSLKEESSLKDRLLASGGESLTPSIEIMKKKRRRSEKHEAGAEDVGVSSSLSERNVDVNNAADNNERKKKKEKKKKKSERHGDCSEVVAVSSSLSEGNVDVNNAAEKNEKKKKKSKRHEACVEDDAVGLSEGNIDVNNARGGNEKKERKRKLEHGNNEKESQVARKKNKVSEVGEVLEETHVRMEDNMGLQKNVHVDLVRNSESEVRRDRKKNRKEKSREDRSSTVASVVNILDDNRREQVVGVQKGPESEGIANMNNGEGQDRKKEKKKKRKYGGGGEVIERAADGKDAGREESTEIVQDKVDSSKKEKKKKKKRHNVVQEAASIQIMAKTMGDQSSVIESDGGNSSSIKNKARDGKLKVSDEGGSKRKKKAKSLGNGSKEKSSKRVTQTEKDVETTGPSEKSSLKATSKRVSFCEDVEVFPTSDGPSDEKAVGEDGLVRGKRFSHEEDEMVKEAVLNYIDVHGLGAEGLNMVLNCKKHPAIVQCWKEIGAALPWRPRQSVYHRAHILFERDQNSSWSLEEYELIRKFHEKHGSDWKTLAEALGKHRFHVKDTWRRIKLINMKKGKWSQDEYQSLFDFVNLDLRLKAFEERKTKHGMLRDNISWTAISEKLETRTDALCCQKWYDQLTSPMVAEGKWLDTDDYRLLMELYDLDACCMEDVDWDNLLEHRSGDICRKRWNQMVKHLGDHRNESFTDQVDVLIKRYCPNVLEAREAYNSKPAVP
ncbi:PREDICTED: DNA-binding protein REB1-like [Populus euphratica]|uniref:DNA-binding protein REB1-like n=1 Tax=Populus euphratica TaxID=75702 RepID=A0AAJ6XM53_POPEU|nr:PREDICTED: DNA-binding protein REB1-like [Populus euphratica]